MIQKVFGVRDGKAQAFLQPFFSNAVGSAIRAFDDVVNDKSSGNQIAKHPEDYMLYELADFDDNSGEFISRDPIKLLGSGRDFVKAMLDIRPRVGDECVKEVVSNGSKEA